MSGSTDSTKIYFRFVSASTAYFSLGWSTNSIDGMSGGDMAVVRGLTVEDRYASAQSTPDFDTQQDFQDINVWVDSAGKTIATWTRLLVSSDATQDKTFIAGIFFHIFIASFSDNPFTFSWHRNYIIIVFLYK